MPAACIFTILYMVLTADCFEDAQECSYTTYSRFVCLRFSQAPSSPSTLTSRLENSQKQKQTNFQRSVFVMLRKFHRRRNVDTARKTKVGRAMQNGSVSMQPLVACYSDLNR